MSEKLLGTSSECQVKILRIYESLSESGKSGKKRERQVSGVRRPNSEFRLFPCALLPAPSIQGLEFSS
jgi:hypothetical protein